MLYALMGSKWQAAGSSRSEVGSSESLSYGKEEKHEEEVGHKEDIGRDG
jgi:hypothetical protein